MSPSCPAATFFWPDWPLWWPFQRKLLPSKPIPWRPSRPRINLSGKLATRTGVVADQHEAAMITAGSPEAMQGAISMYEEIVAGGGWQQTAAKGKLEKVAKGPHVMALRERLVREGYLDIDALSVAKARNL